MKKNIRNLFFSNKSRKEKFEYDYSGVYEREDTISRLLEHSRECKRDISEYWRKMRSYYDGEHSSSAFSDAFMQNYDLPFKAAQSSDGYIHVESQIDAALPEFEFSPRSAEDSDKAKQREKVVRYICDKNNLEFKNSRNERRLGILGSAVWKVCWDADADDDGVFGEVLIDNPAPEGIFPDPTALSVDDCEYIGYVYPMHKEKARRLFSRELAAKGISFDEILCDDEKYGYLDSDDGYSENAQDIVRITEWWFRQPYDGETDIESYTDGKKSVIHYSYSAGDIALCLLIGKHEVRYIPKYWKQTDCKMFPFVIYDRLPKEKTLWGKSELEAIIPFIDAADREIAYAQLNSAFSSNDIIIAEENALCDDSSLDNSPRCRMEAASGNDG